MTKHFAEGSRPSLEEVLDSREDRQARIEGLKDQLRAMKSEAGAAGEGVLGDSTLGESVLGDGALEDDVPGGCVLCFKLNIPGPVKNNAYIQRIFDEGWTQIQQALSAPLSSQALSLPTGPEGYLLLKDDGEAVKRAMVALEEDLPLGRLYDIDVENLEGAIDRSQLGLPDRRCFLCDRPAKLCARSRAHSVEEMLDYLDALLDQQPAD